MLGLNVKNTSGMTIIEILIVTVLISIIAMTAIPSFMGQSQETRRADAKMSLVEAAQQLERCYTEKNSYSGSAGCIDYSGSGRSSKDGHYNITGIQSNKSFVLTAKASAGGAQISDVHCPIFTLSNSGARTATNPDCWQ